MGSRIAAVSMFLPQRKLQNEQICANAADWTPKKIESKLGITSRFVLSEDETPADLAFGAAEELFNREPSAREKIDYLINCTQSPDYLLPTTACLIHERLGLPKSVGSIDINQGCSGYIYGLSLAAALNTSGIAKNVLLLTADGYSKLVGTDDMSVRTIFGDAGTATLVSSEETDRAMIEHFTFGTDGSGAEDLIVRNSGMRAARGASRDDLYMNGSAVLNFTLRIVPDLFESLLKKSGLTHETLDRVILHQANLFLLKQLERKLRLPEGKMLVDFADVGNTVSSTIPIVLSRALEKREIAKGDKIALLGFGVGLSWAGCILEI